MRYPKGSIQLNEARDVPLLRQILRSEYATHSQLFEFMRLEYCEQNRRAFDWRLRRLVEKGLVEQGTPLPAKGEAVYSIASSGGEVLLDRGENCVFGHDRSNRRHAERSVLHALGLNDIHLSGLRGGVLLSWMGALEVRSHNELTRCGFAKDYDAVVTVQTEEGHYCVALEYERSAKTIERYRTVAEALNRERLVPRVLYLTTSDDLLRFVSIHIGKAKCHVYFGLVRDWHRELLDMPVTSSLSITSLRLRDALEGAAERLNPPAVAL